MAYTRAWDETAPLGSAAASSIDTIFQQLKTDLRERLNEVVVDFTADPVVPKEGKGRVYYGTAADRAALTGMVEGQVWYESDTRVIWVYTGAAWIIAAGPAGCRGYNNAGGFTNILAAATYNFIMDTELWDLGGYGNFGTNNQRLTVPTGGAGKYLVQAQAVITTGAGAGQIHMAIAKNGLGQILSTQYSPGTVTSWLGTTGVIDMADGDYIQFAIVNLTANTCTITNNSESYLSLTRL